MAGNRGAKDKKKGTKIPRRWKLTDTQLSLVQTQLTRHVNELRPLQMYHQSDNNRMVNAFRKELGIPDKTQCEFNPNTGTFQEVEPTDEIQDGS